ncbi:MAG: hypothetical protein ACRDRU_26970 [Pseudonocardiaceae bacterium]
MTTLTSVAATVEATLVLAATKPRSTIVQINTTKQAQKNARVKGVERT